MRVLPETRWDRPCRFSHSPSPAPTPRIQLPKPSLFCLSSSPEQLNMQKAISGNTAGTAPEVHSWGLLLVAKFSPKSIQGHHSFEGNLLVCS